jgi:hypothetical protein
MGKIKKVIVDANLVEYAPTHNVAEGAEPKPGRLYHIKYSNTYNNDPVIVACLDIDDIPEFVGKYYKFEKYIIGSNIDLSQWGIPINSLVTFINRKYHFTTDNKGLYLYDTVVYKDKIYYVVNVRNVAYDRVDSK